MKRRTFITLLGGAGTWPLAARAQQPERMRRVGVVMNTAESNAVGQAQLAAFRQRLQELGWTEGRNVRIDVRWGAGDAPELVGLSPDVLLAYASAQLTALARETRAIPIVFIGASDPVGAGFVASFARPGGNITGFTTYEPSLGGKWLATLKEIAPATVRAALMVNPDITFLQGRTYVPAFESAAAALSVEPVTAHVRSTGDIEAALDSLGQRPGGGLIVVPEFFTSTHRELIVRLAAQHRVPAMYPYRQFPESGGLMSYGPGNVDTFRRSAAYIDRILRGEKPAELPVQAPTKFELVINLKTAKALGLRVPESFLVRADEVIE